MDSLPAQLQGRSLVPLLEGSEPTNDCDAYAFTIYPRWKRYDDHSHCSKPYSEITAIGLSVRSCDYRLTDWLEWNASLGRPKCVGEWAMLASELYAHHNDTGMGRTVFDDFESANLAEDPAHADALAQLRARLRAQFESWAAWGNSTAASLR